ncbi:MAG: putative cyclic di-GMP phosphodiesterase PdeG [Pseudomonas citronellolis]|nr:MAG: putative cyclic di-GMP phosphodiesterase PdeG [Pseudomonas citronellolis]
MPLSSKRGHRVLRRLSFCLLMGLLPLVSGGAILYWQALNVLDHESRVAVGEALSLIEVMLDNAASSARVALPHAAGSCDAAELMLREQVAVVPFVRSVNLIQNDSLFCTSLQGPYIEQIDPADYAQGRLRLMAGNRLTPDVALLVYRLAEGRNGALATVDARYISSVLQLVDQRSTLQLRVGPHWMDAQGQVHDGVPPALPLGFVRLDSRSYPFSLVGGFAEGAQWQVIRDEDRAVIGLLVFLALASGLSSYWLWGRSMTPTRELERALHAGEFVAFLQPLVDARSGSWVGAEVLMRWQHPREGLVAPDLFIPMAERSGLIVEMTRSMLRRLLPSLRDEAAWLGQGFHLGVNISAAHCRDPRLLEDCQAFLAACPPRTIRLMLELTERELFEPGPVTDQLFGSLRELGVQLAIDDFGTGHSSLSYLHSFALDALKIDRLFVAQIGLDTPSRHILDVVLELSGRLDLQVIAEGVENAEQRDYLAVHGVDTLQGYLFGRPMPVAEFMARLHEQRARERERAADQPPSSMPLR